MWTLAAAILLLPARCILLTTILFYVTIDSVEVEVLHYISNTPSTSTSFSPIHYQITTNIYGWLSLLAMRNGLLALFIKISIRLNFSFEGTIATLLPMCNELVCVGDFNLNLLNFDSIADNFVKTLETYDLRQIINSPTRVTNTSATLLDLVIVSNSVVVESSGVYDLHISDHSLVYCNISLSAPQTKTFSRIYREIISKLQKLTIFPLDLLMVIKLPGWCTLSGGNPVVSMVSVLKC